MSTQYVTINYGGKSKGLYTFRNEKGPVGAGDTVWVNSLVGPRPVSVVATSNKPPSKKPAPDGYTGSASSRVLREG